MHGEAFLRPGVEPSPRLPEYAGIRSEADANERLLYQIELIRSLEEHYAEGLPDVAPTGSALRDDDEALSPLWLSSQVSHALGVAIDSLRSARLIVEDPDHAGRARLPVMGHYPPLRAALEGAGAALWLLAPTDPHERQLRTLRAYAKELQDDDAFIAEAQKPRETDRAEIVALKRRMRDEDAFRDRREALETVAARLDYSKQDWKGSKLGFGTMLGDVDSVINSPLLSVLGTWRFLSGLSHPSLARSVMGSETERSERGGDWTNVRHTADSTMTTMAFDIALMVTDKAFSTLARRSGIAELQWTRPPILPPGWRT